MRDYLAVILVCLPLTLSSLSIMAGPTGLPQPIYSSLDLLFASSNIRLNPSGNPSSGDIVTLNADVSLAAKQEWTKHGVVLDKGGSDPHESQQVNSPYILYEEGIYRMWYSATDGSGIAWIMYATSIDGSAWTKHGTVFSPGPPGEEKQVIYQCVLKDDAIYKMWYSGYDGFNYRIFLATSPDGLSWTRQRMVMDLGPPGSLDDFYVFDPFVIKEGALYRMWYNGNDGTHNRIFYTESSDGVIWGNRTVSLDLGPPGSQEYMHVSYAHVLAEGGGYHLWYTGKDDSIDRIYYAISADGATWTRMGRVVNVGPPGGTEDTNIGVQFVMHLPGKPYQMWYAGRGGFPNMKIHYATMSPIALPLQADVGFYLDNISPSTLIGMVKIQIDASSVVKMNASWTAGPPGPHRIFAVIDPSNGITETNESNNIAFIDFEVLGDLPTADAGGPYYAIEGERITLDGGKSRDPGNDPLMFRWDFDDDGLWDTQWSHSPLATHIWGDNYEGKIKMEVSDGNSSSLDVADVTVLNVPPSILDDVKAYSQGSLILRVAGEKWHDITATIYRGGVEKYMGRIVRTPGSPDDQAVTLGDSTINFLGSDDWSAKIVYTPEDDPINGQMNGASPSWLIFRSEHGNESGLHHNFNVQHNETWVWDVPDLRALLVGIPVDIKATATDPGSDDLIFTWDTGDGRALVGVHYNNGLSPDPYPSPDVNPMAATDEQVITYSSAGTYVIVLTVTDDDGGFATTSMTVMIGG